MATCAPVSADRVDDLVGRAALDPLPRHAGPQLGLDLGHAPLAALEAEGAPQLLRLGAGEAGRHHRHAEELLLEERHAQRAREDRLQARMRVRHRLPAAPAADVGMHHVADDRARPDDGHLHHEVVEPLGMDARQRGHLGAALDLEDADGVGLLQLGEHLGIVGGQVREIDVPALLVDHPDGVLQH